MKSSTSKFSRGDQVFHRLRPSIPGRVQKQHRLRETGRAIAQYEIEWERSPFGYGKGRTTHEWEADLRFLRTA
jgi:hypothetical protein